ncbi:MAG TPA: transposase [Anaerolineales bacterium]|nr:transposase [Anaerolineales bacterium]
MILFYASSDWSLRLVGVWGLLSGIGYLSDVAVLKRLRNSQKWIGMLVARILQNRVTVLQSLPGVRLRVVDATTISIPGSKGIDWRLHLSFDLDNLCLDGVEITDKYGGESLARFEAQNNEIVVADGAYPFASGMAPVLHTGAGLIVRINWRNVPVLGPEGQRFEIIPWLKTLTTLSEKLVWINTPQGWFRFRLIASPIPPNKLEEARRRTRLRHQRKQKPLNENTLLAAGFILLLTNLPAETWPQHLILSLYRMRWQIELCIKRLKSLLNFDHLRAKDPRVIQTYLLAKFLIAFLVEEMTNRARLREPEWFDALQRPVSVFRMAALFHDALRQTIAGAWVVSLKQFFFLLHRYLCDSPRSRPQQLAWCRAFIQHISLAGTFP